MTAANADQILAEYWARLDSALAPVPPARRQELKDELRMHISEARSRLPDESDADLLNILDRLGDPAETAAAEIGRVESAPRAAGSSRTLEIAALILLVLFWPVGVILLWVSKAWTTRQKLIGTFVPPGGYFAVLVIGPILALASAGVVACQTRSDEFGRVISSTCPSGGAQDAINIGVGAVVIIYLITPLLTAAYLATRLRHAGPPVDHSAATATLVQG